MSVAKSIFGLFLFVVLCLLYVGLWVGSLFVVGFIAYFFLALGGIVPPVDFIPFIPYI